MELIIVFFVFTLAGLVGALTGFGVATVAMILLPFFLPLSLALPVVAMASTLATGIIAVRTATPSIVRKVAPLLFGSAVGVSFGMLQLAQMDEQTLRIIIAAALLAIAVLGLMRKRIHFSPRKRYGLVMGLLGGFFSASFNIHGPLVALYAAARGEHKREMRGLIAVYMFLTGLFTVTGHALAGSVTIEVLRSFFLSVPFLLLGLLLGRRLFHVFEEDTARRFVYGFVGVAAFLIFVHAVW